MKIPGIRPQQEQEKLKKICDACPKMRSHFSLFGIRIFKRKKQCSICKCFIDSAVAVEIKHCPINKW
jgi:hypothetical protein